MEKILIITCKLAISERPARRQTMLAGGFASAMQRSTNESLPSSRSMCGVPIICMDGASETKIEQFNNCKLLVEQLQNVYLFIISIYFWVNDECQSVGEIAQWRRTLRS